MNTAVLDDDSHEHNSEDGVRGSASGVHVRLLAEGTLIGQKYVIRGKLGQGGFAVVYDAEHVGLGRPVAIKVVHLDEETPMAMLERSRREARISALVRHRNVLEVFDSGTLEDGSPYLVMERLHGETLSARIARRSLSVPAVVELGCQVLTALEALAKHGIVHRDIKSDNLMLHDPGDGHLMVKLLDFGISKRSGPDLAPRLTTEGTLVGTPSYMSPEQLRGESLDVRTDIYSVGVVLYEALTGHVPHERTSLSELLLAALHDKVRPIRQQRASCPRELERIVLKALAREKELRYPTPESMRLELESFAKSASLPCAGDAFATVESLEAPVERLHFHPYLARLRVAWDDFRERVPLARASEYALVIAVLTLGGAARIYPASTPEKSTNGSALKPAQALAPRAPSVQPGAPSEEEDSEPHLLKLDRPPEVTALGVLGDDSKVKDDRDDIRDASDERPQPSARSHRQRAARRAAQHAKAAAQVELTAMPEKPPQALAMEVAERQNNLKALMDDALAAYALGRYGLTQELYRKATLISPDEPSAWRGLGLVATRLGQYSEARHAFERYLTLAPRANDAAAIRARVQALPQPHGNAPRH
jgi:serine/threonine-protein kinase